MTQGSRLLSYVRQGRLIWQRLARALADIMPKGLFVRALVIVIAPMVLLQSIVAYIFLERHWENVSLKLSSALSQDIAAMIDLKQIMPNGAALDRLIEVAARRLELNVTFLAKETLPLALPKPFFAPLDRVLSNEIRKQIGRPFWIDTVGKSDLIEIRIVLDDSIMRILVRRSAAAISNSHIFIVWMLGSSMVLLGVAIAFLRNQIRPIQHLAQAAQDFGKGRDNDFRPHGAREVRQAGYAFIEMKRRIERTIEQRTTMLNGVSHDLRTIITRFRLSLALLGEGEDIDALQKDTQEMQRMLEAYLAFARGDTEEQSTPTDIRTLLEELKADAERHGHATGMTITGGSIANVRPDAFRRLITNLVSNAQKYGQHIQLIVTQDARFLTLHIDDDGPGIPAQEREDVFRPFYRRDEARNQDTIGTGLGLAIARDIARAHGGDIQLADSPIGGLRASVRIPV
jgi:two-component system osmolarity sensor histidine kinase EnvZ